MSKGLWVFIPEQGDGEGGDIQAMAFLVAIVAGAMYFLYGWAVDWVTYAFPASSVAAFYYWTICFPFQGVMGLWRWISPTVGQGMTSYSNANIVLALVACVAVMVVWAMLVRWFLRLFGEKAYLVVWAYVLGPWLLWGLWAFCAWMVAK